MMGEHWQKIDVKQIPDEGETMETVLDEVCERVKGWHKKKYPEMYSDKKQSPWPTGTIVNGIENNNPVAEDKEWEEIKTKLEAIEFQEDAQKFILTTNYAMTIEAKKIINSKPLKNKK